MTDNRSVKRVGLHPDVGIKQPFRKPVLPNRQKHLEETERFHEVLLKAMDKHNAQAPDQG